VALPVSISRALVYKYAVNLVAVVSGLIISGRGLGKFAGLVVLVACVGFAASSLWIVQDAQKAFVNRWESGNEAEGGDKGALGALQKRTSEGTISALAEALDQPIFGRGIGLGTNVGAMRVSGRASFMVSESAWGGIFGELGPLLGAVVLAFRLWLAVKLGRLSYLQAKQGNTLPMFLSGFGISVVLLGTTSQPTSLGFVVLGAGLLLAACNPTRAELVARANRTGPSITRHHLGNRPESADPVTVFVAKGI
jgi:hypothetical protein